MKRLIILIVATIHGCGTYTTTLKNEIIIDSSFSIAKVKTDNFYRLCKFSYIDSITTFKPVKIYDVKPEPIDSAWYNDTIIILFSKNKIIKYGLKDNSYLKLKEINFSLRKNFKIFKPS